MQVDLHAAHVDRATPRACSACTAAIASALLA